jgi:mevalonate pyrophosphate decarboxylase
MAKKTPYFYYRIYDDEERFNYFRTTFEEKKIRRMLKKYEKDHQEYHNAAFVEFLREHDSKAELIEVAHISY